MSDDEATLASFVATLDISDVPDPIVDRTGLVIADTIGAIIGGSTVDTIRDLRRVWEDTPDSTATVLGTDVSTSPLQAAFCNGAAGTALELDEGHRFAGGHPAIHVLPALLAAAEADYGDSDRFVAAFVAAYDVAARVGRAAQPLADGYHPHGVWGCVGGAAAVARYRELDTETTRTAMAIAANYAQHTHFAAATEGATVRNGYAGMSNLASLVAVEQAEAGFSALDDGIARHLDTATADGLDQAELTAALGDRWELDHDYFKRHAACRYTHAALDAVERLSERATIVPESIESVHVETYPAAAQLTTTRPNNALQAKFSIPFAVGTALTTGETGKAAFTDEAISDEALAVAERVAVSVSDDIAARAPDERGARVTVDLGEERHTEEVRAPKGGEHDPLTENQLRQKFDALVAPVLGAERAATLWERAREPVPVRVLCALCEA